MDINDQEVHISTPLKIQKEASEIMINEQDEEQQPEEPSNLEQNVEVQQEDQRVPTQ